ncbi:MAG: N-6 DNA methylase [Ectothiorhodospiraceae bacterium AqS1]|nr:N-6 DNA methylase [Ectothiorhodospiraceae bacterium AqS1]
MGNIPGIEKQRMAEQQRLDALKNAAERNRLGQFATPPELARDMIRYVKDLWKSRSDPISFLDPAIGTGAFFSALKQGIPGDSIRRCAGFEIDTAFAETGRRLWQREGLQVTTGDFMVQPPPDKCKRFNLIFANPPYVRHHHLPAEQKERCKAAVEQELGLNISGLAGLYCYFLLLADRWLTDDGIGIWLIPSEFMTVNYGEAVKRYLLEYVQLLHIHRFCPSDVQFSDALVSSAIVVFQKNASRPARVRFSFGGSITHPDTEQQVPYGKLALARRWARFPGADRTDDDKWKLGDLFSIKRGIATGANRFFILPKAKARLLGIPRQFQKPILPSPRYLSKTVIASEKDGYPVIDCPLSLIDCSLPEKEIQQRFPRFWEYLETGKRQGVDALYLPRRRSPWYSQERRRPGDERASQTRPFASCGTDRKPSRPMFICCCTRKGRSDKPCNKMTRASARYFPCCKPSLSNSFWTKAGFMAAACINWSPKSLPDSPPIFYYPGSTGSIEHGSDFYSKIAMYQSLDIGSVQMRWHAGECRYQRLSDPLGVYRAAKGTVTPPNSTSMWYRYGAGKTQAGRLRPTKHLCRIVERVQDDRISKIGFRK